MCHTNFKEKTMDIDEKTYRLVMICLSQLDRDNIVSLMLENEQSEKNM